MEDTKRKLLSTGYLQALEVGAETIGGKRKQKKGKIMGLLWWRAAVDSVEYKLQGLQALLAPHSEKYLLIVIGTSKMFKTSDLKNLPNDRK